MVPHGDIQTDSIASPEPADSKASQAFDLCPLSSDFYFLIPDSWSLTPASCPPISDL